MSLMERAPRAEETIDWALGPGAVSWEVFRNPAVFLVGILREAILLTLHLPFAAAATDHDGVHTDPAKRFRTIARYAYSVVYGTKAEAELVSGFVRRRHAQVVGTEPISGERYQANSDYELVLTQVLLCASWLAAYESIHGRLSDADRARFLAEQKLAGALLGIPPNFLPDTTAEMEAFLARARETWAAGEQARAILKPFAEGEYPAGSVLGELPPLKRRAASIVVRAFTDMSLSTMSAEERSLLAIGRRPQLGSQLAVAASLRMLASFFARPKGQAVFERFLKPDIAKIVRRARAAEAVTGPVRFVAPDATPFVATLDDRVENMR